MLDSIPGQASPIPRQALAQTLMTLAGIAYGQPSAIPGYLAADTLTQGQWSIAWIAAQVDPPVNFAYIAQRTDGAYAIAIRGTYPNPLSPAYWDDGNQDNPIGPMQTWPGTTDAQVSNGTWTGFQSVIALADTAGTTFAQAVASIPNGATVYVTGHSLGGTLTPVIALWLSQMDKGLVIHAMPFAGMTPGNQAFADLFGPGTPLDGCVTRYNNTLDTVPYGWDRVLDTRHFYEPAPQGGLLVEAALGVMALRLVPYGYTSIGNEVQLQGVLQPPTIDCTIVAYVLENLHQHMPDTYLDLLGAPKLPFSILFGAVVAPKTDAAYTTGRMPVHFV